jgi:hypothetical protein
MHNVLLRVELYYTVMISYVFGILAVHAWFWEIHRKITSTVYPYYY